MVPYWFRIYLLILLSFTGMISIAFCEGLPQRLFGIALASASSGLGEISFLQLTHFYDSWSLGGFSSGTGAAGLVGSFVFMMLTSWMGITTKTSLIMFSLVPILFAVVYKWVLPSSEGSRDHSRDYTPVQGNLPDYDEPLTSSHNHSPTAHQSAVDVSEQPDFSAAADEESAIDKPVHGSIDVARTLQRLRPLVVPFM
ncbi:Yhc3p [Sugiyamaella lignohabitans]|uniref:Protein BTN n=1 Tax=Sugiyamaella lignohabitans TaxID=796027 RepID=A0A167EIV3_9ASCO|nr:Yhc3p [Sugiyamaella lignohabitans]ANB14133.1 Yhc3p [Sugiyamaella lignohabitans]